MVAVADVFLKLQAIADGGHQVHRGGPSISKAIDLVAGSAKSGGTGKSRLWTMWDRYKDVAHLIAAACMLSRKARELGRQGHLGLKQDQFVPFQMVLLMPDLVLAIALPLQEFGFQKLAEGRKEGTLSRRTTWGIPPDINVRPARQNAQKLPKSEIRILNARRSGNRGKANQSKTTPIFG